ncbi:MAG: threonine synthase, partial [Eggerthellaceae bacterium]|nr:threonine synthase [Eggerthellaceae bacterium]
TCVWGVLGNFDDCQGALKRVFADEKFTGHLLKDASVALSSANSINWGRLLPQVVYYVCAYSQMVADGSIEAGDVLDVCVPTGNFGNILAAWYAKSIGVPIGLLFCASNENRVLTDFINTGTYDISDRTFVVTPSPSMDILISSNLERQLFELSGRNAEAVRGWMEDLARDKTFRVDKETFSAIRENFSAESVDSATCLQTIKKVFDAHHYLIDPHTAVAFAAAERLRDANHVLVVSTAHWAKFGANVYRALHGIAPGEPLPEGVASLDGCRLNELIALETGVDNIPRQLATLDEMPVRFDQVIGNDIMQMESVIDSFTDHSSQKYY